MKIGICIVGLYRDKLSTMDVKDITKTVHDQFPDADFYYHTWDSEKNKYLYNITKTYTLVQNLSLIIILLLIVKM